MGLPPCSARRRALGSQGLEPHSVAPLLTAPLWLQLRPPLLPISIAQGPAPLGTRGLARNSLPVPSSRRRSSYTSACETKKNTTGRGQSPSTAALEKGRSSGKLTPPRALGQPKCLSHCWGTLDTPSQRCCHLTCYPGNVPETSLSREENAAALILHFPLLKAWQCAEGKPGTWQRASHPPALCIPSATSPPACGLCPRRADPSHPGKLSFPSFALLYLGASLQPGPSSPHRLEITTQQPVQPFRPPFQIRYFWPFTLWSSTLQPLIIFVASP